MIDTKNDCACSVCQVTRRKNERDEILAVDNETAVMNSNISDQHNMKVNSGVNNPGSHDTASSQEQPPQTDVYKETVEADDTGVQMETLGKFLNNRPSNFPLLTMNMRAPDNTLEEKEEVDYKDLNNQEERTSTQPNDVSEVAHHQQKQENHSFLQLCITPFPRQPEFCFPGAPFFVSSKAPSFIKGKPPTCRHDSDNETVGISQLSCSPSVSCQKLQAAYDFGKAVP